MDQKKACKNSGALFGSEFHVAEKIDTVVILELIYFYIWIRINLNTCLYFELTRFSFIAPPRYSCMGFYRCGVSFSAIYH
jgi:hypothetical protein